MSLPSDLEKLIVLDAHRQRSVEARRQELTCAYDRSPAPFALWFHRFVGWAVRRLPRRASQPQPQTAVQHRHRHGW